MMYALRVEQSAVQGRQRSAHRPARLAATEQREELSDAGRHAPPPHERVGGLRGRQPVLQRQQEQASTRRPTASSRTRLHGHAVLVGQPQDEHRRRQLHEPESRSLRHPESALRLHVQRHSRLRRTTSRATSTRRRCSTSTAVAARRRACRSADCVGNAVQDNKSTRRRARRARNFLDPNFVSINNTEPKYEPHDRSRSAASSARSGRRRSNFRDYLYLNVTGRNDWTSTIPQERNSFFYPCVYGELRLLRRVPVARKHFMTRQASRGVRRSRPRRAAVRVSPVARVQDDVVRRLRLRLHGPEPALKPEFAKVVRVRHRAELPRRPPRHRRDGLPQADEEPDRPRTSAAATARASSSST